MQNTFGPHLQNLMITSQNSSPAVPHSITGCFATQNIGEVARSDGGVSSKKILVKIIYLMGKIGSFLLPAFSFAEKKQQQSTSHLMCAASQNARRVLRFRGTAPLRNARLGMGLLYRSGLPASWNWILRNLVEKYLSSPVH